ncbi:MAG: TMEM175 family protein [Patescibacteria group bacterium]
MFSKARLEALSDGVFAIVLTLLVIEIRVPEHLLEDINHFSESELIHSLQDLIPLFLSFFLSFAVLTTVWITHHFLFTIMAKNSSRILQYLNFLMLAFVSLVPFSSNLLGTFPFSQTAITFYSANILLITCCTFIIREYIIRSKEIENPEPHETKINKKDRLYGSARIFISASTSILAVLISFFSTTVSIILLLTPVVINLIPGSLAYIMRVTKLDRLADKL